MPNVLIIDDDANVRNILSDALQGMRYDVTAATDGLAGLKAAQAKKPDLVILDVEMPGISGYEVCSRLRGQSDPNLPILMLTGRTADADAERGLDSGADAYMTKPFTLAELSARVRILLKLNDQL